LAMVGAFATIGVTSGLITLAFISYQAISQLAPTLLLGIFWKRGTAAAAVAGMVSGIASATVLQVFYPISIPWFGGATAGVIGLLINTAAYIVVTYALPMKAAERQRVERLFSRQAAQEAGDFAGQPNEIVATVSRSH